MSKNKHPVFYSTVEGLKLVKQSYFALHVEYTTATDVILATFTNEEMCAVRFIESIYKEDVPYISCPVNSTYAEYLLIGSVCCVINSVNGNGFCFQVSQTIRIWTSFQRIQKEIFKITQVYWEKLDFC